MLSLWRQHIIPRDNIMEQRYDFFFPICYVAKNNYDQESYLRCSVKFCFLKGLLDQGGGSIISICRLQKIKWSLFNFPIIYMKKDILLTSGFWRPWGFLFIIAFFQCLFSLSLTIFFLAQGFNVFQYFIEDSLNQPFC